MTPCSFYYPISVYLSYDTSQQLSVVQFIQQSSNQDCTLYLPRMCAIEEDAVSNKNRNLPSIPTHTTFTKTAGCLSNLPSVLQVTAVSIITLMTMVPGCIHVQGFSSSSISRASTTQATSTFFPKRQLVPTQSTSLLFLRSDFNTYRSKSKALQVLHESISKEWREDLKLKNSFCVFDFDATNENGQIVRDITYQANLQISQLIEQNNSKSSRHSPADKDSAIQAERILNRLEELNRADTITYNLVINAFSKSSLPDSTIRAEKVLNRMENFYQQQRDSVKRWSQCVGKASTHTVENQNLLEECGIFDAEFGGKKVPSITVKPNVRTYSTVIDAYSRTANENVDGAEAGQALLEHLRTLYESTGDEELKPNVISYNSVINAWAKTGTVYGAETAMKLLITMENEGIADVISYNAVIHAWARCGSKDSGDRAEGVLQRMKDRAAIGDEEDFEHDGESKEEKQVLQFERSFSSQAPFKPNIRTYSSVIDAWSRSKCPTAAIRAQANLNEMEKIYERTGDRSIQPNTVTYSTVINAYARSRNMENKASAALQVLKRMQQVYDSGENEQAKPSVVTYNSVLNACATTYGVRSDRRSRFKEEKHDDDEETDISASQSLALGIVKALYKETTSAESDIQPDHFTYGTVLKACANLMSPWDDDAIPFIKEVFEQCCDDGQVSFGVCFQLRQAAPVELYRDLIPQIAIDASNGHFVMDRMPKDWSRHLKERRRASTKR